MGNTQDDHIQGLAQGGLATHVISNPDTVDKVFSVATVQNMPEVKFAAAFPDGTLVLGCPDGVPAQLADRATSIALAPVASAADRPSIGPPEDLGNGPDKINLSSRLEEIERAVRELGALDVSRIAASLDDLHEYLAVVGSKGAEDGPTEPYDFDAAFAMARSEMQNILQNALARPEAPVAPPAVLAAIDALGAKLSELADRNQAPEGKALAPEVADRLAELAGVTPKLNALAAQVAALAKPSKPEPPHAVMAALAQIQSALEAQAAPDVNDQEDILVGVRETLEQISQSVARIVAAQEASGPPPDTPDFKGLEAALGALQSEQAASSERLDRLADAVEQFKMPSAPVLDLAPQRKSFAHFTAVLNAAVSRLEASAEAMAAPSQGAYGGQLSDLKSDIESLRDEIQAERAGPLAALDALRSSVDTLVARPSPQPDLSAQRKSFAQFGTALNMVLGRLEALAGGLSDARPAGDHLTGQPAPAAQDTAAASTVCAAEDFPDGDPPEIERVVPGEAEQSEGDEASMADTHAPITAKSPFDADDPEALADLRAVLAETLAREMQRRAGAQNVRNGAAQPDT